MEAFWSTMEVKYKNFAILTYDTLALSSSYCCPTIIYLLLLKSERTKKRNISLQSFNCFRYARSWPARRKRDFRQRDGRGLDQD